MSGDEARECVVSIKASVGRARNLLLDLYEREGWRVLGYSSWRECVANEFGQSQAYLYNQLQAAQIERNISSIEEKGIVPESQLRPLQQLEPDQQCEVWAKANETAPNGKITAAHVQSVVDEMRGNGHKPEIIHVSDDSYEWYTPIEYIDAVREVMGWISLDPASCEEANGVVGAETFFTKEDDGLAQDWFGHVFLNPPYNMPLVAQFTARAIREYENADVEEAIVLVNNATDATWFHALLDKYQACFTRGRLKFWTVEGPNLGARQGQVFFYLGRNPSKFTEIFSQFGIVVCKYDHQ